jgi:hypothetical protein
MALHNYLERRREEERVRKKAELAKQAELAKWTGIGKHVAQQKRAGILAPLRQFLQSQVKRNPGLLASFEKGYNVERKIHNPGSRLMRNVMTQSPYMKQTHQQLTQAGRTRPITNIMFETASQGNALPRVISLPEVAGLPPLSAVLHPDNPLSKLFQGAAKNILRTGQQVSKQHNIPLDVRKVRAFATDNPKDLASLGTYTPYAGLIKFPLHTGPFADPGRVLSTLAHETGHGMENRFYDVITDYPELLKDRFAIANVTTPFREIVADGYRQYLLAETRKRLNAAAVPHFATVPNPGSVTKNNWLQDAQAQAAVIVPLRNMDHARDISKGMGGPARNIYDEAEVLGHMQYLAHHGGLPGSGLKVVPQEQLDAIWKEIFEMHKARYGY